MRLAWIWLALMAASGCSDAKKRWYPKKIQGRSGEFATLGNSGSVEISYDGPETPFAFKIPYSKSNKDQTWCMNLDPSYEKPNPKEDDSVVKTASCSNKSVIASCIVHNSEDKSNYSTVWYQSYLDEAIFDAAAKVKSGCEKPKNDSDAGKFVTYLGSDKKIDAKIENNSPFTNVISFTKKDRAFCQEYDASDPEKVSIIKEAFSADTYTSTNKSCAIEKVYARCNYSSSGDVLSSSVVYYADQVQDSILATLEEQCKSDAVGTMRTKFQ